MGGIFNLGCALLKSAAPLSDTDTDTDVGLKYNTNYGSEITGSVDRSFVEKSTIRIRRKFRVLALLPDKQSTFE